MDLERLATSEIEKSISKTDKLATFINSGDKEPCWDGHIYIHQGAQHAKAGVKRVSVQVKGKAVLPSAVKDNVKYSIAKDDLEAYIKDSGTMFFVVYIDKYSGDPLQIYYAALLPLRIKKILEDNKKKYPIQFEKFPENNFEKEELFLNFHMNSKKQTSFISGMTPTIEDLRNRGILESLSFSYTSVGGQPTPHLLPRKMEGKSLTIYANVTGISTPIPVEYHDKISDIVISNTESIPVSVAGKVYYEGYNVVTTADQMVLHIGSCVKLIIKDGKDETCDVTVKIKIKGTLQERIRGMEFVGAMIEHKSFEIGKTVMPSNFPDSEVESINVKDFPDLIDGYKRAVTVLEQLHVKKTLDFDKCTKEDIWKLNFLIDAIENGTPVRNIKNNLPIVCNLKISNLWLVIVCEQIADNTYHIWDFFNKKIDVVYVEDDKPPIPVSQYANMKADDFINVDNIDLDVIVDSYKHFDIHPALLSAANMTMLELIKVYDKKSDQSFLIAAKQLCGWIKDYPDIIDSEISLINELQIVKRERELTFNEKNSLHKLLATECDDQIKIGALLLLDYQNEASELFEKISEEEAEQFKEYPIYRFYNAQENGEVV